MYLYEQIKVYIQALPMYQECTSRCMYSPVYVSVYLYVYSKVHMYVCVSAAV